MLESRPASGPQPQDDDEAGATDPGALLSYVAAGDRLAFRRLYDQQSPRLYAVAMRITRQSALAADAVHDAFLQVWRNAARDVSDVDMPEVEDTEPDPLARLQTAREASALHRCLETLEPERRKLVLLAFTDGLSHSELAERLATPMGTIKSWIRRSLLALKSCLEAPVS